MEYLPSIHNLLIFKLYLLDFSRSKGIINQLMTQIQVTWDPLLKTCTRGFIKEGIVSKFNEERIHFRQSLWILSKNKTSHLGERTAFCQVV